MKKKYILVIIIFIFFIIGGYYILTNMVYNKAEQVYNEENKSSYEVKQLSEENDKYILKIFYPQTDYSKLDKYILNKISKIREDFFSCIGNDIKYTAKCSLEISFSEYQSLNKTSFLFRVVSYTNGAHPNEYYFSVNFDTKQNKIVTIDDFIIENEKNIEKLKNKTYEVLKDNEKIKTYVKLDELKKDLDRKEIYENIIFDKESIIITINRYEIAPYVAGSFEVKIPLFEW